MNYWPRLFIFVLCPLLSLSLPIFPAHANEVAPAISPYAGFTKVQWEATGWFRLHQHNGRHWLVTPDGHPFFNLGINHLSVGLSPEQREDPNIGIHLTRQFRDWGFNTAGYGSPACYWPHTPFVAAMLMTPTSRFLKDKISFPDVFDPQFKASLEKRIENICRRFSTNKNLIGYQWNDTPMWDLKDARRLRNKDWVSTLRQSPAQAPGKMAYIDFLLEKYHHQFSKINEVYEINCSTREELLAHSFVSIPLKKPQVWEDDQEFLGLIARHLYQTAGPAFKKNDPHHLIWSEMYFQNCHPARVLAEAAPYIDVLVIQPHANSSSKNGADHFAEELYTKLYETYQKPIVIGDHQFSFATPEHPRTMWFQYPTPSAAANGYAEFLEAAIAQPYIIGYNRCQIRDAVLPDKSLKQGILQKNGEPYHEYADLVTAVNHRILKKIYAKAQ